MSTEQPTNERIVEQLEEVLRELAELKREQQELANALAKLRERPS